MAVAEQMRLTLNQQKVLPYLLSDSKITPKMIAAATNLTVEEVRSCAAVLYFTGYAYHSPGRDKPRPMENSKA